MGRGGGGTPWGCKEPDMTEAAEHTHTHTHTHTHAAAAAAKSLQACLTLCDSIDGSPSDSAVPGISQARTVVWFAISFSHTYHRTQ